MSKTVTCPWCEVKTELYPSGKTFCMHCQHRADVPQGECDCRQCRRRSAPAPQRRYAAA